MQTTFSIQSFIRNINNDLNNIQKWANNNVLCLNAAKSKLLTITNRGTNTISNWQNEIMTNNSVFERVESSKKPGVEFVYSILFHFAVYDIKNLKKIIDFVTA